MKLLITIPKEFEQHFQADRFEDSLHRLSADAHLLAGLYEQETALMLSEVFKSAAPVPPHRRLIDADALPLEENVPTVMMHNGERWISAYELAMAPIIIPAEEAHDE